MIIANWIFFVATWFLVIADWIVYVNFRCNAIPSLELDTLGVSDPTSWVCASLAPSFITTGQVIGSGLLFVGSALYFVTSF